MKQLLRNGTFWLAGMGMLLTSCTGRKTGTLKIGIEIVSLNGFPEERLNARIRKMVLQEDEDVELKDIRIFTQGKQINLEVSNFAGNPDRLAKRLSARNTGLQIYETYDVSEIYPMLMKLDETVKTKNADPPDRIENEKAPETLQEKMDARQDSITRAQQEQIPFKGLLNFSIYTDEKGHPILAPGAVIGTCRIQDTAALFPVFRQGAADKMLPASLLIRTKWLKDKNVLELYALRLSAPFMKPAMEGDIVLSAMEQKSEDTGQHSITLQFSPSSEETWRLLTKKSAPLYGQRGKSLAMVLNDEVLSAPVVNGEIAGGSSSISGNFTMQEVQDLCAMLNAPYMPCTLLLQKIEIVPDK